MSKASASRTIKFISKAGTYSASIMSPTGDLYQMWKGTMSDVTEIFPNFASVKPTLLFVCTSSRTAEGIADPDFIDYYVNGQKLAFSGGVSTTSFNGETGHFKTVTPSGDNLYYGLQIVKDLVKASGFAPLTIKMVAHISYGIQSDTIEASYVIPIQQATGDSVIVTIAAGDTKNFVINDKGGSCILKAMAYENGTALTKDLTYVWEKLTPSGWSTLSGKTVQTLTVSDGDIDTYGEFRVTVKRSGTNIGSDIQGVMDASDPYDIAPRPDPEDETITEDETGNGSVTYTPWVVKRGTQTKILDTLFKFVVKDSQGNFLNPSEMNTAKASCTVTRAQCVQAGGDVSIDIFTAD